jgi:hypothetical protein
VTATLSFWSNEILDPGFHGASLSAVIAATALFLRTFGTQRPSILVLAGFALLCAGLVMSNRYLSISLVLPMALVAALVRQARPSRMTIILTILAATVTGFAALHFLNASTFYRLMAPGVHPRLDEFESISWWKGRLPKELRELLSSSPRNQILFGLAVLGTATLYGTWLYFREASVTSVFALRRMAFALITALSALCAITFEIVMVDDSGAWRYRYLIIPFCLALFVLCAAATTRFGSGRHTNLVLATLTILFVAVALIARVTNLSNLAYEAHFRDDLAALSALLAKHDGNTKHTGLANYWPANEISVRDESFWIAPMSERDYMLYNDNAWDICGKEFTFILIWDVRPWPNVDTVVSRLGPPLATAKMDLGRFKQVQILFYEPARIDEGIVQPALAQSKLLFPGFHCS